MPETAFAGQTLPLLMQGGVARFLLGKDGWTILTPSLDSKVIYVSQSAGNDSNSGLTDLVPKKTIAAGRSLMRNGYPDWLLLKKGDTWQETLGADWRYSGRSLAEPMVLGAYGAGVRPIVDTGGQSAFWIWNATVNNLAITEIAMAPRSYDGSFPPVGVGIYHDCSNILIEGCDVSGYFQNIVFDSASENLRLRNMKVRRCVVADAWASNPLNHAMGIFAGNVDGITIEGCTLDQNGWTPSGVGHVPTIYRHNGYIINCTDELARDNIVARTDAIQMRSGGMAIGNVCSRVVAGLTFGKTDHPIPAGVVVYCQDNAVIEGQALGAGPSPNTIFGYVFGNVVGGDISGNIAANALSLIDARAVWSPEQPGFPNMQNVELHRNIFHEAGRISLDGPGSGYSLGVNRNVLQTANDPSSLGCVWIEQASGISPYITAADNKWTIGGGAPSFRIAGALQTLATFNAALGDTTSLQGPVIYPAPTRNLATYSASIGGPVGHDAFLLECRNNSKDNWRADYTAENINAYLRAGFGL